MKYAADFVCEPLTHIFNCCFDDATFPEAFKFSKVVPIFKKNNNLEYKNYRPICIIPTISNVFEKIIKKQVTAYFERNKLFTSRQFGFRSNHSTVDAVVSLVGHCLDEIENGNSVCNRFFDLSRAFDTVSHDVLLHKLKFYGFNNIGVNLIKSYLFGRYQSVFYNNCSSNFMLCKTGVPQGSVLGPLLFIIYVNDLPANILSDVSLAYMYADDLALTVYNKYNDLLTCKLMDINTRIIEWCNANRLKLNHSKTVDLKITTNNQHLSLTPCTKFLGIYLESSLSWQSHIDYIANKLSKSIFIIRVLKPYLNVEALLSVYYAHIYSHLSYGILLWGNHSAISKLFVLQKRCIRLICGAKPGEHCKPFFVSLGVLTLSSMYVLDCLLYVKKNISNLYTLSSIHNRNTRNNLNIYKKKCKYSLTQKKILTTCPRKFTIVSL